MIDIEFIVTVENKCTVIPNQNDLYTQGFTTKENGGRGLSSVRMLAKKTNYYFKISVDDETDTVIAEIRFPKS